MSHTLKLTDPDLIQMDDFKNEQLLSLTINLLLFIRSQVPVTKKLFQSCECTQKTGRYGTSAHSYVKLGSSDCFACELVGRT